jgi:hypothetical protein
MTKLDNRSCEWRMTGSTRTIAGELTESAVNDGQSWGFGIHVLGWRNQQLRYVPATKFFRAPLALFSRQPRYFSSLNAVVKRTASGI